MPGPTATVTLPIGINLVTAAPPTVAAVQITSLPQPTKTPLSTPTPLIYLVVEGDTVAGIAAGLNTTIETILGLNPGLDPNLLSVGQPLLLPTPDAQAVEAGIDVGTAVPVLAVVADVQLYQTPTDAIWLLGTAENVGALAIEDVKLEIGLADAAGNVLQTYPVWTAVRVIPTQGIAPFGLLLENTPSGFDHPLVSVVDGLSVAGSGSRYLDFEVTEIGLDGGNGSVRLEGMVKNGGAATADKILLVARFYNEQNHITGFQNLNLPGQLAPGESAPFVVTAVPPGGQSVGAAVMVEGIVAGSQ